MEITKCKRRKNQPDDITFYKVVNGSNEYHVVVDEYATDILDCNCPDYFYHKKWTYQWCKHMVAVEKLINK